MLLSHRMWKVGIFFLVVDSVGYEPSNEEMPVSEGPDIDNHDDCGPETPFPGLVDILNTPDVDNFAGAGPVEPLLALPHSSDPPEPVHVIAPGLDTPVPEFRLLLEVTDLSRDSASAAEDFFAGPGPRSACPDFVDTIRLKLVGSPPAPGGSERAPPEPGGFMRSGEKLCTGYGILSQEYENMLFWLRLVCAFRDGFGSALQEFGDVCTMDLACPCLHETLLIGPRSRPFSPSVTGDAHPSYDLEIPYLSAPQPFRPLLTARAMGGVSFFEPDDTVSCWVSSSLCLYVIGWHWICVIQLASSGTVAEMMGVAVDHDNAISLTPLSRLEGSRSQYPDWLLITLQWAELDAPPISMLGHTVVSGGEDERLHIRHVFDWCYPFVTGSLFFVAPVHRQATAGRGRVVLCSSQVSAGVLLWAVDFVVRLLS